jgi:hypothetical protein
MICAKPGNPVLDCGAGRALITYWDRHIVIFLAELSFRKRYFVTAWHTFAVKSPLVCAMFIFDLQQAWNS